MDWLAIDLGEKEWMRICQKYIQIQSKNPTKSEISHNSQENQSAEKEIIITCPECGSQDIEMENEKCSECGYSAD